VSFDTVIMFARVYRHGGSGLHGFQNNDLASASNINAILMHTFVPLTRYSVVNGLFFLHHVL